MTSDLAESLAIVFADVPCPLCGGTDAPVRHRVRGRILDYEFTVRTCTECGLYFTSPRLSDESLTRYYNSEAVEAVKDRLHIPSHHTFDALGHQRNAHDAVSLWRVVQRQRGADERRTPTVLDVGCGFGQFLSAVSPLATATGIEISEFCVARATATLHGAATVRQALLSDVIAAREQYDIVTAFEVVEHLTNPSTFFGEVRQVLRPGGVFYYSTGNVQGKAAQRDGAAWEYWAPEEHLLFYAPETMTHFLRRAGLRPTWRKELPLRSADERHRIGVAALASRGVLNPLTYALYRMVSRHRESEVMPFGVRQT